MLKRLTVLLVLLAVMLAAIPVSAAEDPIVYKSTIEVTNQGGRYQIGFVNLEFKKEFIESIDLPVIIDVEISVFEGKAGIELNPSIKNFCKQVHIRVDSYEGLLYDTTADDGSNNILVPVKIKKQQLLLEHFSRHAFS